MLRLLSILAAAAILIASGVVHGLRTDRWGLDPDLEAAAARLDKVADNVGEWHSRPTEMDRRQLKQAEVTAHISRNYVNDRTGASVGVLIVCGRSGPISLHTPDVCYRGQGYVPGKEDKYEVQVGDVPEEMWVAQFDKPAAPTFDALRIYWGWTTDGIVKAPKEPRVAFNDQKVLYKVYVIRKLNSPEETAEKDPSREFLAQFLPELRKALATGS
jgi:hypothetical protein